MKSKSLLPKPLYWLFVFAIFLGGFALRMVDIDDLPLDFHPTRQLFSALKVRGMYYAASPQTSPTGSVRWLSASGKRSPPSSRRSSNRSPCS